MMARNKPLRKQFSAELKAVAQVFMPRENNSALRKIMTVTMMLIWGVNFTLINLGYIQRSDLLMQVFMAFTFVVIVAFAKAHEIEVQNILGMEVQHTDSKDKKN